MYSFDKHFYSITLFLETKEGINLQYLYMTMIPMTLATMASVVVVQKQTVSRMLTQTIAAVY